MKETIITAYDWRCPECGEDFTEEDLMDLMGEPFNGIALVCPGCEREYSIDILIKLVSKEEEG